MKKTEMPKCRWVRIQIIATETHCSNECSGLSYPVNAYCTMSPFKGTVLRFDRTVSLYRRCAACKRAEVKR